jgi:hypothetical protein
VEGVLRPGGTGRLVALLERYGEAIQADLAWRGWDLALLWRQRRWQLLLTLVDHLPGTSHTLSAMADDDELAARLPETKPGPPPLESWTPEVDKLTLIADRLGELITAVHNTVAKRRAKPPRPLPRPQTARDRLKRQRGRAKHDHVKAQLARAAAEGRPTMADGATDHAHAAVRPPKAGGKPA